MDVIANIKTTGMNKKDQQQWEQVCLMLNEVSVSAAEVFFLGLSALKAAGVKRSSGVKKAQRLIRLGEEALKEMEKTVSFSVAVEDMLKVKQERLRVSSMVAIKSTLKRLMRNNPKLANKPVRSMKAEDCKKALEAAFHTPRQFVNGRSIMSAVFGHAVKRGWTDRNPVAGVDIPVVKEQRIKALPLNNCRTLMSLAHEMYGGACEVAAGMMLYAGIRPTEVTRLRWGDVLLEEGVICVPPRHSKTGGARHVGIQAPLKKLLCSVPRGASDEPLIPPNWPLKWRAVRKELVKKTGVAWQQDILRHTFASFYVKEYRDISALQLEMGHSSSTLLRTRYLNMEGLKKQDAREFWLCG